MQKKTYGFILQFYSGISGIVVRFNSYYVLIAALIVALLLASFFSKGIHDLFEQYKKRQKNLQQELEHSRDELELRVQSRTG